MASATRKTELSPLEAIVVERILGDEARRQGHGATLARIQSLTRERQQLYAKSSAHPFLAATNGARIRAISAEIEALWPVLRRERAARRTQIERALHVVAEDDDENNHDEREHDECPSAAGPRRGHSSDAA